MPARHIVAIGGSDAGISAALRARQLDPDTEFTVVVADAYPNFSICGIPYYISGEVAHWTDLAHRSAADLAATGMTVLTDTTATRINPKRTASPSSMPTEDPTSCLMTRW
jgi:NADPH-dependent 2,4-dienoyl-CoA reductase/sulfur reductase-like enzyme